MSYAEKRKSERVKAASIVTVDASEPDGTKLLLTTSDICIGGCALRSIKKIGKGRVLIANIVLDTRVVKTIINVVSEEKIEHGYRVGVEFLFVSPEDFDALSTFIERRLPDHFNSMPAYKFPSFN